MKYFLLQFCFQFDPETISQLIASYQLAKKIKDFNEDFMKLPGRERSWYRILSTAAVIIFHDSIRSS